MKWLCWLFDHNWERGFKHFGEAAYRNNAPAWYNKMVDKINAKGGLIHETRECKRCGKTQVAGVMMWYDKE